MEISRLALQARPDPDASKRGQQLLTQLNNILEDQIQYDASVLDEKIADYVFFPLSHVLRKHNAYPIRLIETVIKSLRLLIQYGWKARISKDLSQQLLILLTFIIGGVPGDEGAQPVRPEETILEGYRALTVLIKAAGLSAKDSALTDAQIIPSLGHTVSVILDGVTDGRTPEIQLEALQALSAVYNTIKQDEVLATFFPGTVSSLSRLLSPPIAARAQKRVLVSGVNVLRIVLTKVLSDLKMRNLLKPGAAAAATTTTVAEIESDNSGSGEKQSDEGKVLTLSWLKATGSQVKIALSTILKLRNHESTNVRKAVGRLCISLLDECHSSLSNCTSVLVESAIVLREGENEEPAGFGAPSVVDDHLAFYGTSLEDLATIYPELMDSINITVYNWVNSMPRAMQSSDERVKQQAIRNILKGQELVSALGGESSNLQDSLSAALRDSIVALILNSKSTRVLNEVETDENLWQSSDLTKPGREAQDYRPVILAQEGQRDTRRDVARLIQDIGTPTQQTKLAAEMLLSVRDTDGVDQISSFWLSFELLKASFAKTADVDELFDFDSVAVDSYSENREAVFNELYSFSVSILDAHSDAVDEVDWRLEAIALEVTAFAASRLRQSFRPELIDVLYPISTFLGSAEPQLRGHAITTLNSLAIFCGYENVSDLIIDNVDYMVNSVSLRLNQFDISPSSTKVLTMMIRLTGPKLLPFLDDVVAGIFAALDNYHGYTSFVESLFGVLSEVVEQGVKSDVLLIDNGNGKRIDHKKKLPVSSGIEDTITFLERREKRKQEEEDDVEEVIRGHPEEAWKSAKDELDALDARDRGEDEPEETAPNNDEVDVPKTPTYTLLTKITSLTQHYLTSPTPTLRKRLLDLLSKVSPALAPDENAFLPMVNDVWPVIISRIHDTEPYVVIAACGTLGALCASAGDFLSSRIKTEWWDGLRKWCFRARSEARRNRGGGVTITRRKGEASGGSSGILIPIRGADDSVDNLQLEVSSTRALSSSHYEPGLGMFASAAQMWNAVVSMLVAIVSYVKVEDDIFDDILELVAEDVLMRDEEGRRALEAVNADAVWLAMCERGWVEALPTPVLEGTGFVPMGVGSK